jgi:hypothetical protein
MAVQPEIDDVAHAQCGNVRQLRFAWLAGRGYPVIETMPVIDGLGIDHHRNISGLRGDPKTAFCTVARFGFVQNSNRPQRMPIALPPEEKSLMVFPALSEEGDDAVGELVEGARWLPRPARGPPCLGRTWSNRSTNVRDGKQREPRGHDHRAEGQGQSRAVVVATGRYRRHRAGLRRRQPGDAGGNGHPLR